MSDTAPSDAPDAPQDEQAPDTGTGADLTAEVEKWKAQARKHEERAKANAKAAQELEQFRQQSMTDTERMIEQARVEERQKAYIDVGGKVAAAEVRAAAAGRLDPEQVEMLLEGLNLARFIGDDGEVDRDAVLRFVDGIAPKATETTTATVLDLGQGTRAAGNTALNGDPLLRDLKSKLGIA